MDCLPSLPDSYYKINSAAENPTANINEIAEIIKYDVAMSAKILQLSNSAFFGIGKKVSSIKEAVTMLGVALVSDLALTIHLFESFNPSNCPGFSINELWNESISIASLSASIAALENQTPYIVDASFLTGILHKVGRLVLASELPKEFNESIQYAKQNKIPTWKAEQEIIGVTYSEVGAFLGNLWAFPLPVIEGIAYHTHPKDSKAGKEFCPLTAIHASMSIRHRKITGNDALFDTEYLASINMIKHIKDWEKIKEK